MAKAKKEAPAAPVDTTAIIAAVNKITDELVVILKMLDIVAPPTEVAPAPAVVVEEPPAAAPAPALADIKTQAVVPTTADLRAALTAYATGHGLDAARKVMSDAGFGKVSDVPAEALPALLKKLA